MHVTILHSIYYTLPHNKSGLGFCKRRMENEILLRCQFLKWVVFLFYIYGLVNVFCYFSMPKLVHKEWSSKVWTIQWTQISTHKFTWIIWTFLWFCFHCVLPIGWATGGLVSLWQTNLEQHDPMYCAVLPGRCTGICLVMTSSTALSMYPKV